jgi:hypothetical protein
MIDTGDNGAKDGPTVVTNEPYPLCHQPIAS